MKSVPDRCIFIGGIFEFDHTERQTVYENDYIRAAVVFVLDNRELINGEPLIRVWIIKINDFRGSVSETRTLTPLRSSLSQWERARVRVAGLPRQCRPRAADERLYSERRVSLLQAE